MPAMRAGTYYEGELWLRCYHCGDSPKNPNKAHFSVNTAGLYHCFRCGHSGKLSMKSLVELYAKAGIFDRVLKEDIDLEVNKNYNALFEQLLPGPASQRFSALDRFQHGKNFDVFLSRRPSGELVGLALAPLHKTKSRRVLGNRAFGFVGEELISTPEQPVRLVEGPYDVLTAQDVCVFGLISVKHMRALRGHYVILCPDGDVWTDSRKLGSFLRCVKETRKWTASVVAIERLEDDKDPDQVQYQDRWNLTPEELLARHS